MAFDHAFSERSVLYFQNFIAELSAFWMIAVVMRINTLLFLVLLAVLAQACGQTGPLYLPDSPPPVYVPKQSPDEEQ